MFRLDYFLDFFFCILKHAVSLRPPLIQHNMAVASSNPSSESSVQCSVVSESSRVKE